MSAISMAMRAIVLKLRYFSLTSRATEAPHHRLVIVKSPYVGIVNLAVLAYLCKTHRSAQPRVSLA